MKQSKAFTLIEIVVVAGLVALITGVTGLSFSKLRPRASTQGLATLITEEIRQTRQEAVAHRRPVAFVIPKGPENFSRSFYVVEGETMPRIVRSSNYSNEYNGAGLFVGSWPTTSAITMGLPVPAGSKWGFNNAEVASWIDSPGTLPGSGAPNDFYFIFLPDGSVRTNQLPAFDGSYHILVCNGVKVSGGLLSEAGEAFTISISSLGGISLEGGVTQSTIKHAGSLSNSGVPLAPPLVQRPQGALSATDATPGNPYPTILPQPGPTSGGVKAYVKVGQFLTFDMGCASASGDELFGQYMIQVANTNGSPPGTNKLPGAFSMRGSTGALVEVDPANLTDASGKLIPASNTGSFVADGGRLEWSQKENCWRSTWQWTPPPEAIPGDVYTLQPLVRNTATGAPQPVGIPQQIKIDFPGAILYQTNVSGSTDVYSMRETGHNKKLLRKNASQPTATRTGSRIAWVEGNNIKIAFRESPAEAYVLNDPANPNPCDLPALSPAGNFIAFRRSNHVYVMNTIPETDPANNVVDCGLHQMEVSPPDSNAVKSGTQKMSWGADGLSLYFVDGSHNLMQQNFVAHSVKPIAASSSSPIGALRDPYNGGPWCAPSCGIDDTIFLVSNWNQGANGYDPWFWRYRGAPSPWYHKTVSDDEATPERCPRGGNFVLESWRNNPADNYIIRKSDNGGASGLNAVFVGNLTRTSEGNCLYPVWTH